MCVLKYTIGKARKVGKLRKEGKEWGKPGAVERRDRTELKLQSADRGTSARGDESRPKSEKKRKKKKGGHKAARNWRVLEEEKQ